MHNDIGPGYPFRGDRVKKPGLFIATVRLFVRLGFALVMLVQLIAISYNAQTLAGANYLWFVVPVLGLLLFAPQLVFLAKIAGLGAITAYFDMLHVISIVNTALLIAYTMHTPLIWDYFIRERKPGRPSWYDTFYAFIFLVFDPRNYRRESLQDWYFDWLLDNGEAKARKERRRREERRQIEEQVEDLDLLDKTLLGLKTPEMLVAQAQHAAYLEGTGMPAEWSTFPLTNVRTAS